MLSCKLRRYCHVLYTIGRYDNLYTYKLLLLKGSQTAMDVDDEAASNPSEQTKTLVLYGVGLGCRVRV